MNEKLFYNSESFEETLKELKVDKNSIDNISTLIGFMSFNGSLSLIKCFGQEKQYNIYYSELVPTYKSYSSINDYLSNFLVDMFNWILEYNNIQGIGDKENIKFYQIKKKDDIISYHGKIYNFSNNNQSYTMIGSSNLSYRGINFSESNKISNEVNIIEEDNNKEKFNEVRQEVKKSFATQKEDFSDIWQQYVNIKEYKNGKELFQNIIEYTNAVKTEESINKFIEERWSKILKDYQIVTLKSILKTMNNFGGSVLNYDVGLGKTLIGVAVADYYGSKKSESPIIIAPKRIVNDWKEQLELEVFIDGKKIKINDYFNSLGQRKLGFDPRRVKSYNDFMNEGSKPRVIIIDEAHNFRNRSTKKRKELLKEIYDLSDEEYDSIFEGGFINRDKIIRSDIKVLLITATPCQNGIEDIQRLLDILPTPNINDDEKTELHDIYCKRIDILSKWNDDVSISNIDDDQTKLIRNFFNRINKEKWRYEEWKESFYFPRRKNIDNQNKFILDKEDEVVKKILNEKTTNIEKIDVIIRERNNLKNTIDLILDKGYLAENAPTLNKFNLYFSIDSSYYAFICSLFKKIHNMKTENMNLDINLDDYNDKLFKLTGIKIEDWKDNKSKEEYQRQDFGEMIYSLDDSIDEGDEFTNVSNIDATNEADDYENSEEEVKEDRSKKRYSKNFIHNINSNSVEATELYKKLLDDSINSFITYKDACSDKKSDYKLAYLKTLINEEELKDRKIIIFVNRLSTMRVLFDDLKQHYKGVLSISGKNELNYHLNEIEGSLKDNNGSITKYLFSPLSNHKPSYNISNWEYLDKNKGDFKILIATNTFAEGHNLQDATVVINYDLDWNPSIMLQRIGRVDRHRDYKNVYKDDLYKDVYVYNLFFSDKRENSYIDLHERLLEKTKSHDIFRSISLCELYNDKDKNEEHKKNIEKVANDDFRYKLKEDENFDDVLEMIHECENNLEDDLHINKIKKISHKDEDKCCQKHILIDKTTSEDDIFIIFEGRDKKNNKKMIYYWNECNTIKTDFTQFLQKKYHCWKDSSDDIINISINDLAKEKYIDYLKKYQKFIESIDLKDELNVRLSLKSNGYKIDKIVFVLMMIGGKE